MKIIKLSLLALLFLTFFTFTASAKNAGDVSATVKDIKTKEPIAFASVELLNVKDSLLIGCITDSRGYFELTPPVNTSKIRIRFVGYKNLEMPLKEKELNDVFMEEDARQLNELNVTGSARTNKIDRDVYTITKTLRTGTTSSQELLGKLNGVNFNVYDKSISVNGSTNVLILVDGIEKDQQYAKNLQPDRVDRVEIIKDPIGKYATDGYSAVINIILKKDFTGIDVSVSNTAFFDFVGTNEKNILIQDYGNFNVNYIYKKLNVYSNGSLYSGNFHLPTEYKKQYGDQVTTSARMDASNPNIYAQPLNTNFAVGADYTFSKKHILSTELKYSDSYDKSTSLFNLTNSIGEITTGTSSSQNISENNTVNLQAGISYKGLFNDKNTVDADVRYYRTDGYNYNYYQQENFTSESDIDLSGDYVRTNVNYTHIFSPKFNMELGYGNVYFTNTNTLDNNSFTRFNYRNRASLYASYRPFEKLNTKIGGIVENYTQSYGNQSKNLAVFLPFANVQFVAGKNFNIVARYQSSAQYPSINQLNPYKMATDSILYSSGNPALKTGINNTVGMDFNLFNVITLSPYYTFNKSYLSTYIGIDPDNNQHYLSQNVNADNYERYGARLNFTVPFGKKLFWQNNLNWSRSTIAYLDEKNSVNNWGLNSSLIYVNPAKGLLGGLIYQKQLTRDIDIQGYNTNGNDIALIMLRKSFLKQKLNLTLFYSLPIDLGLSYDLPSYTKAGGYYLSSMSKMNFIKHLTFIEVSYNFSAGKKTKKVSSSTDEEFDNNRRGTFGL